MSFRCNFTTWSRRLHSTLLRLRRHHLLISKHHHSRLHRIWWRLCTPWSRRQRRHSCLRVGPPSFGPGGVKFGSHPCLCLCALIVFSPRRSPWSIIATGRCLHRLLRWLSLHWRLHRLRWPNLLWRISSLLLRRTHQISRRDN